MWGFTVVGSAYGAETVVVQVRAEGEVAAAEQATAIVPGLVVSAVYWTTHVRIAVRQQDAWHQYGLAAV